MDWFVKKSLTEFRSMHFWQLMNKNNKSSSPVFLVSFKIALNVKFAEVCVISLLSYFVSKNLIYLNKLNRADVSLKS